MMFRHLFAFGVGMSDIQCGQPRDPIDGDAGVSVAEALAERAEIKAALIAWGESGGIYLSNEASGIGEVKANEERADPQPLQNRRFIFLQNGTLLEPLEQFFYKDGKLTKAHATAAYRTVGVQVVWKVRVADGHFTGAQGWVWVSDTVPRPQSAPL